MRQVIKETSVVTLLRSGKKSVANSHISRLGKYKSENRFSENVNLFFAGGGRKVYQSLRSTSIVGVGDVNVSK